MVSRPWSPVEVEVKIAELIETLDKHRESLPELRDRKASAERSYRREKSKATLLVQERNKERRDAAALTWIVDGETTVADLAYERDLAEHAYWDAKTITDILRTEAGLLRSLIDATRGMP